MEISDEQSLSSHQQSELSKKKKDKKDKKKKESKDGDMDKAAKDKEKMKMKVLKEALKTLSSDHEKLKEELEKVKAHN
jgi:hypothetical protein